ncbi:MAG: hypothetical protein ACYTBX_21065, partial [Planctomycetota bacterium]
TADDPGEDITVNNNTDLVIAKTVDDATPDEGQTVTYTITLTNNGPAQATNISVTDVVPAGVTYVAASITGGDSSDDSDPAGAGLSWTVNTINSGANTTLTFQATVDAGTSGNIITNTATKTQDQIDTDLTADDPSEDITVNNNTDLVIAKTVDDATPDEGQTVTYTITLTNNGPAQASIINLTDIVPAGVTYVAASITGGNSSDDSDPAGAGLSWTVNSINSGANTTLTFQATVDAGTSGNIITNTATKTQDQIDTDLTADDPGEDITVNNDTDLVIAKTVDDATPDEGQTVTYTITLTNNGPAQATNISVTDIVPAGVTYVAASITGGSSSDDSDPSGAGLSWTVNSINSGANTTLTFQTTVDAGTSGNIISHQDSGSDRHRSHGR